MKNNNNNIISVEFYCVIKVPVIVRKNNHKEENESSCHCICEKEREREQAGKWKEGKIFGERDQIYQLSKEQLINSIAKTNVV